MLIADEPTTALDVTVQAQIMALLRDLRTEYDMAVVLITHDLALVAEEADRVAVMYAGNIVETGPVAEVFANPQAPLHQGPAGLGARATRVRGDDLKSIGGIAAGPALHPDGLRLPGPLPAGPRRLRAPPGPPLDAVGSRPHGRLPLPRGGLAMSEMPETLLEVRDLTQDVPGAANAAGKNQLRALDGIDLDLARGETLGLVGESGCGKSTLARTLMMLERPDAGTVTLRRRRPVRAARQGPAEVPPPGADGVPGPVRVAELPDVGGRHHRRAVAHPQGACTRRAATATCGCADCSTWSGSAPRPPTSTRRSSPAVSVSASASPARWR